MNRKDKRKTRGGNNIRVDKPLYLEYLERIVSHPDFPTHYGEYVEKELRKKKVYYKGMNGVFFKKPQIYSARKGTGIHWNVLIEMGNLVDIEVTIPDTAKESHLTH